MNTVLLITVVALLLFVGFGFIYLLCSKSIKEKDLYARKLETEVAGLKLDLKNAQQLRIEMEKEMATLSTNLGNLRERYEEQMLSNTHTEKQFQILANQILDQKARQFDEDHKKGLKEILEP